MPEKLTNAPRSRQRRTSSGPPVKQWKIVRVGHSLGGQDVERVGPRVAAVDHERQPVAVRELDLGGERVPLRLAWSVVVVVVEPGLADGDDAGCVEQVGDRVDAGRRLVGVEPDRGEHARVGGRGGDRRFGRGPVAPDRDHLRHAGLAGRPRSRPRSRRGSVRRGRGSGSRPRSCRPVHVVAVRSRCGGRAAGPW